jgi:hypothetical protein
MSPEDPTYTWPLVYLNQFNSFARDSSEFASVSSALQCETWALSDPAMEGEENNSSVSRTSLNSIVLDSTS